MKKNKFILILIIFSTALFSCEKYPDGGFSINAKKKIIGTWSVEYLSVDGVDSTANFKSSPNYCEYPIIFGAEGYGRDYPPPIGTECIGLAGMGTTYWQFEDHKKVLWIDYNKGDTTKGELSPLIFKYSVQVYWKIKRLKKSQMWLLTNFNSKEYYIKLNKKSE